MRHHKGHRKFGRSEHAREALMISLARSLILKEKITTTEPKAKELRPYVEKLMTIAKKGGLANRRVLISRTRGGSQVAKLMDVLAPKYANRAGGYLRIVKMPARKSDAAKLARIEFV